MKAPIPEDITFFDIIKKNPLSYSELRTTKYYTIKYLKMIMESCKKSENAIIETTVLGMEKMSRLLGIIKGGAESSTYETAGINTETLHNRGNNFKHHHHIFVGLCIYFRNCHSNFSVTSLFFSGVILCTTELIHIM